MLKVTYKTSNLFSLKKYSHSNLNCQSYEYPTLSAIRGAILGQIINLQGVDIAQELFHKVKNSNVYIAHPECFHKNMVRQKRFKNNSYDNKKTVNFDSSNSDKFFTKVNDFQGMNQMGVREYVDMNTITFYIDKMIPNVELYLKNIDWLGDSNGLVYLESIEEVTTLKYVLTLWDRESDVETYENWDWHKSVKFNNVYIYDISKKMKYKQLMCSIKDLNIAI